GARKAGCGNNGIAGAKFAGGTRDVRGIVASAVFAAHGDAGLVSDTADDRLLRIWKLGADISAEARLFAFAFAGVHDADCAGLAGGTDFMRVDFGPSGAEVDDRGVGVAGGGVWVGIWQREHTGGGGRFWGAADAVQ